MLISEPFFFSKIKFFATACVKKYSPLKFVFITTSKSWNTVSTEAECFAMPAEFTKMSKVSNFESGTLWKYAQSVGDATNGAVTHPGAFKEKKVYADI